MDYYYIDEDFTHAGLCLGMLSTRPMMTMIARMMNTALPCDSSCEHLAVGEYNHQLPWNSTSSTISKSPHVATNAVCTSHTYQQTSSGCTPVKLEQ